MKNDYNPFTHLHGRIDIIEAGINDIKQRLNMRNPYERLTKQMIKDQYYISLSTVNKYMSNGKLKFDKVGTRVSFTRSNVEKWIKENRLS